MGCVSILFCSLGFGADCTPAAVFYLFLVVRWVGTPLVPLNLISAQNRYVPILYQFWSLFGQSIHRWAFPGSSDRFAPTATFWNGYTQRVRSRSLRSIETVLTVSLDVRCRPSIMNREPEV